MASADVDRAPPAEDTPAASRPRRPALLGAIAGLVGIGCCLVPVVLVLLGLSTATAAVDLGNRLFAEWGWAFKLAGLGLAGGALWIQGRRARACPVDVRPSLLRNAIIVLGVAALTYAVVYAVTTWLGGVAS